MNTPPPEITDPLLKSLIDEAADLPRIAALEAHRVRKPARERAARRSFDVWAGLVRLMRFRAAQAAVALLILAAMVEGGSLITGEGSPLARKRDGDLLSAATVTTKSGEHADATDAYWAGAQTSGETWNTFVSGTATNWLSAQTGRRAGGDYVGRIRRRAVEGPFATADSGGGAHNATWSTGANWGDTSWNSLGSSGLAGAGGLSGTLSAGSGQITSGARTGGEAKDNMHQVQQLFTEAKGFYDAGRYDLAYKRYDQILGLDPTNTAARKGQEGVLAAKNRYANEAYNETRGSLNWETTKEWETQPRKYLNREAVTANVYQANSGTTSTAPSQDQLYSTVDDMFYTGTTQAKAPSVGKSRFFLAQNLPFQTQVHRPPAPPPAPAATPAPVIDTRKLIRNAALDFEVGSFERALDTITAVAGEEQGYIFSQNSAKGANGKLQGQVIVKVLPANLDRFLLKLRALGDMKNQTVAAQDVSKDYYDTEARIRNSEVTEARLIDMLKNRTGKVSDLLEVENEIAKVRGEIEQMQGQLKFYDALVQYATVTISLEEKDLNQAAAYLLTEQAQLCLFSKDVEKAFTDAKSDATDAKAQTLESHIERDEAGHVIATLHLLIPPDVADETIVKLKEIGRIQHFNSQTQRVAKDDGDNAAPSDTAKVDRDKVELTMTIQQDAENPVQGTNIGIQTDQVEEKTAQIKQEAAASGVEVKGAEFNRASNGTEISAMLLRLPMKKYAAFLEQIKSLGKVKEFTVSRREDATATEDAPAEIALQIYSQPGIIAPESGLWVTVRGTVGEGMSTLMWSLRMIGVSLAFIAPWALLAGVVWLFGGRRWLARK